MMKYKQFTPTENVVEYDAKVKHRFFEFGVFFSSKTGQPCYCDSWNNWSLGLSHTIIVRCTLNDEI